MFPTSPPSGSRAIPAEATFWMPKAEEITEDGIVAYFRNTWLIDDVSLAEARTLKQKESLLAQVVGSLANTADDFERLAEAAERGCDPDEDEQNPFQLSAAETSALDTVLTSGEFDPLESLELGVAGLAYALAAVGIIPVASCRGHAGEHSWSDVPVVFFAATAYRAAALESLTAGTNCRFGIDPARPDLITVMGGSILDTMTLADVVLASHASFVEPGTPEYFHPNQQRLF